MLQHFKYVFSAILSSHFCALVQKLCLHTNLRFILKSSKSSLLVEAKREQIFGFDVTECIFVFLQVANLSEIPLSHETI